MTITQDQLELETSEIRVFIINHRQDLVNLSPSLDLFVNAGIHASLLISLKFRGIEIVDALREA